MSDDFKELLSIFNAQKVKYSDRWRVRRLAAHAATGDPRISTSSSKVSQRSPQLRLEFVTWVNEPS